MPVDPVRQIVEALPVLHHAVRSRVERRAAAGQVSDHQLTILAQLGRAEAVTVTELAARMRVALPTMSLLVERLVRAGLLRRERDPKDGRRVLVRLSAAGGRLLAGRSPIDPGRVRALLAALTPAERAAGVEGVTTLARAARRLAGQAGGSTSKIEDSE
jgi:DNA-binding MarR family transcriptional regulator